MPVIERTPDIFGIENEYTCMLIFPDDVIYEIVGKCHSVDHKLGLYAEPKLKGTDNIHEEALNEALIELGLYVTNDGMLSNGARFYIDPSGPEYATPETPTAEDAVHRTYDGDDIMLGVFGVLRDWGILKGFQVNRRNVDHNRNSRAVHLNTMTKLPVRPSEYVIDALATLNVVKGAMFGSGGLLIDETGQTHFHHSPRLSLTDEKDMKSTDFKFRPLVRHPFKQEGEGFARVETVTSDALNFAWPLRASMVVTNALIRMIELREDLNIPSLLDPISAAMEVGRYGYAGRIDIYKDSDYEPDEKPLKVLADMCKLILKTDEKEGVLNDEAHQVLPEIIDVADRMDLDPMSVTAQVESVARLTTMEKKMAKSGITLDTEKMCRFDYAWDWLGGGIAERLRNKNLAGWQGFKQKHSSLTAEKRRNVPPPDTRAKIRGDLIKDRKGRVVVHWSGTAENYYSPLDTTPYN